MGDLPQIARVDNVEKLMQIVYADESTRKDKTLAYLNQTEIIDYNANRLCDNGHQLTLKRNTKTDGWWWRCSTKGCQQTKSIRLGTFFNESRLAITQVLLLVLNFAFEFLNTTMYQISGIAVHTVAAYKRRLRLIILTMFNKNDIRIGGEGRIVEIDESLFIKVKHNRGRDTLRPKVWVFMKEPTNLKECYFLRWILEMQLHY